MLSLHVFQFKQLPALPETITPAHDKNGILLMKTLKNDQV